MIIEVGDYAEALKILKSFYPDPLKSGDMGIYMAPLLIMNGEVRDGQRILDQMLQAGSGDAKQEWTALGVAELLESQLKNAEENLFKRHSPWIRITFPP